MRLDLVPVPLGAIFEECRDVFAERLAQKTITLEVDLEPGLSVMAEPVSLSNSVINNLVSNAIKFSYPKGKVTLKAHKNGDRILVEVRDQGMGMNEDLLSKVFLKTEKTSRPGTSLEKGTGFGMPIVKRYLELYGGSIQIQSTPRENSESSGTLVRLSFRPA